MLEDRIKCNIGKRNIVTAFVLFIIGYISHIGIWLYKLGAVDANCSGLFHYTPDWEATLGRWLIKPIDAFNSFLAVPSFTCTVAVAIFAISTTLILSILEIEDIVARVILGALFIMTPCIGMTLSFFYCAIDFSLALLFSAMFAFFIKKNSSLRNAVAAGASLVISLAIYQAYVGTAAALCLSLLIIMLIKGDDIIEVLKKGLYMIGTAIVGTVLYYIILNIVIKVKGIELGTYGGANKLLETTFLDIKIAIAIAYQSFMSSLIDYSGIYDTRFYRGKYYVIAAITISLALLVFIIAVNYVREPIRIISIVVLFLIYPLAAGVVMLIVKGHGMSFLMSQGKYVFFLLLGSIVLYSSKILKKKMIDNIGVVFWIAVFLFTYELFVINSCTYEYFHMRHNSAISTGNRVLAIAEMLPEYESGTEFCFAGKFNNSYPVGTMLEKMSLEEYCEWGSDYYIFNNAMIENMYRDDIGCTIKLCNDIKYTEIVTSEQFDQMPVYPCNGSIKIIDGVCVVKMEEDPSLPSHE